MATVFNTPESISAVITNKDLTLQQKIDKFVNGSGKMVSFLKAFEQYRTTMSNAKIDPKDGAYQNVNLYNKIKNIVNQEDYDTFKAMFDVVNLYFLNYKDGVFAMHQLHRFDYVWTWGDKKLSTYQIIVATVIPSLCNRVTRASNLKRISFANTFNKDKIELKDDAITNIRRYYTA